MKLVLKFLFLGIIVTLSGCTTFDDDLDPVADFELSSTDVSSLEIISLTNLGEGEFFTVYTGTNESRFEDRVGGIPGNDQGIIFFSYDTAGTFTMTFVASTYVDGKTKINTSTAQITVRDTVNLLNKITFDNIGQVERVAINGARAYSIESFPDAENNVIVPVFNFSQYGFIGRSQVQLRPNLFIDSKSFEIEIENNQNFEPGDEVIHFNFENRYRPITYEITSQAGQSREFLVSVLEIPEFESFSIGSAASGKNRIHPATDFEFFTSVPLPDGTDASNVTPTFELFFPDETTVTNNGNTVNSGSGTYDLSSANRFDLLFVQQGFEEVFQIAASTYVRALEIPAINSFSIDGVDAEITQVEEGNTPEFHVDITIPLPEGATVSSYLNSLTPFFSTASSSVNTTVTTRSGEQTSGISSNDFLPYYNEFITNPNSFDLDDLRVAYTVENFENIVTDSATYSKAFSLQAIYKVGVLIE